MISLAVVIPILAALFLAAGGQVLIEWLLTQALDLWDRRRKARENRNHSCF